jgi:outer membrane protein OmpA-like peptidoglycan-associated protein
MSVRLLVTCLSPAPLLRIAMAVGLVTLALPALGAQGSLLAITVGPHETRWLDAKELKVRLDGPPLNVTVPAPGADPGLPVYADVIPPGKHTIEVEAGFTGNSAAFSYVEGYVFRMNGQLEIDVPPGQGVTVNVKVVARSGLTVEWTDKFTLALSSTVFQSERAAAAQLPESAPALAVGAAAADLTRPPPPAPTPTALVRREGAGACTVEPPRFRFGKHDLQPEDRARLEGFAACLNGSGDAAVIAGHADATGPVQVNKRLSTERARAVVEYLVKQGVERKRLAVKGYGSSRLACTEKTAACNARNRRAEAIVSQP